MANYINKYTNIDAYNADDGKQYPNVSYLVATDEVKWVKDDPVHIVCKYNVTSTSNATKLLNSNGGITYQIIDGVKQDAVQMNYTFDALGEHIVKYKLDGTSIGYSAFYNCSKLTSIIIPDSVTSIGGYAFGDCTGLTSITIGTSVTSIGNNAFQGCRGLTSITIGTSVTSIGNNAFQGCRGLTSITIGTSVTSIGNNAFNYCTKLTSITIGSGVTSIGSGIFEGCSGLTSIVVDSANTVYDSRDNCNAIVKTSTNELIAGCKNTVIPNTVTSIGEYAFQGCTGLTSITIPNTVTNIGYGAFNGCTGLTNVTIGNGITNIDQQAFVHCTGLTSLTINAITPPTLGANAFYNTNANLIIYVPTESVDTYKTATNWSSLASRIKPISE